VLATAAQLRLPLREMSVDPETIRNYSPGMQYRRFGKTEQQLSVITLGGMRYRDGWTPPRSELRQSTLDQCRQCVQAALDAGINHIETAYGYGTSEKAYGRVLGSELRVARDRYHLMTKGRPLSADDTKKLVDKQLRDLQVDHIDLYGWHGINDAETLESIVKKGGPVEALLRLQEQGVIGSVGFSTHARTATILGAIETGLFSFINLHYYYFFQNNAPALAAAAARDMGVFIISPNDKGGQLYKPSQRLRELTQPATPIQWNARFCLSHPQIHTLSFGMTAPAHFAEMRGIFPAATPLASEDAAIQARLDAQLDRDPHSRYTGLDLANDPSGINIPEVLRLRRLWKCYDMLDYGRYRYNMFANADPWYPGQLATAERLSQIDASRLPQQPDVKALLSETHAGLFQALKPETGH
jgi:predicted aldo/keto reductase-like oxidoreductase